MQISTGCRESPLWDAGVMVWPANLPLSAALQQDLTDWAERVDDSCIDEVEHQAQLWRDGQSLFDRLREELVGSRFNVHWDAGTLEDWTTP